MRLPARLLRRSPDSHKGDFGRILILAGSLRFLGAAALSANAAMRSGAGLVTLGVPKSLALAMLRKKPDEVMLLPLPETKDLTLSPGAYKKISEFLKNIDILLVGPGLTQNKSTQSLIRRLLLNTKKPVVIDADGINALAGHMKKFKSKKPEAKNWIITPHAGEMARLSGTSTENIRKDREQFVRNFAKQHKLTLVLKGRKTLVADKDGNLYANKTGNPGMATAGSGDVLSGIIAAFLGQGLSNFAAAKYAVYLHGLAGDLAAKEKTQLGMIASDITEKIPEAIKKCS